MIRSPVSVARHRHWNTRRLLLLSSVLAIGILATARYVSRHWPDDGGNHSSPRSSLAHMPEPPVQRAGEATPLPPEGRSPHPAGDATTLAATVEGLKQEAIIVAKETLAHFPESADALKLMGDTHIRLGSSVEAERWWQQCLARQPNRADVHSDLALVAYQKQELDRAVNFWRRALELEPRLVGVHDRLARALVDMNKPDEAITVQEQGVQMAGESASAHFQLGQAYLQRGEYEKACRHYEKAVTLNPRATRAYYGLATALDRLGRPTEAESMREKFRQLKADDLEWGRQNTDASADLAAVRRHVTQIYHSAGGVYHKHNDAVRSEQLWLRGASIDPGNVPCRLELATRYRNNGNWSASRQAYERLAQLEPQNVGHQLNLGGVYNQLGDFASAEKAYQRVAELAPQRAWGHVGLCRLYVQSNRKIGEAKVHAETAVRLEPVPANYRMLGEACRRCGDAAGALSAMRRAAQLDSSRLK